MARKNGRDVQIFLDEHKTVKGYPTSIAENILFKTTNVAEIIDTLIHDIADAKIDIDGKSHLSLRDRLNTEISMLFKLTAILDRRVLALEYYNPGGGIEPGSIADRILKLESDKYDKTGGEIDGDVDITGDILVRGNSQLEGDVDILGIANVQNHLRVLGNTDIVLNLTVDGQAYVGGKLSVDGNINSIGQITVNEQEVYHPGNKPTSDDVDAYDKEYIDEVTDRLEYLEDNLIYTTSNFKKIALSKESVAVNSLVFVVKNDPSNVHNFNYTQFSFIIEKEDGGYVDGYDIHGSSTYIHRNLDESREGNDPYGFRLNDGTVLTQVYGSFTPTISGEYYSHDDIYITTFNGGLATYNFVKFNNPVKIKSIKTAISNSLENDLSVEVYTYDNYDPYNIDKNTLLSDFHANKSALSIYNNSNPIVVPKMSSYFLIDINTDFNDTDGFSTDSTSYIAIECSFDYTDSQYFFGMVNPLYDVEVHLKDGTVATRSNGKIRSILPFANSLNNSYIDESFDDLMDGSEIDGNYYLGPSDEYWLDRDYIVTRGLLFIRLNARYEIDHVKFKMINTWNKNLKIKFHSMYFLLKDDYDYPVSGGYCQPILYYIHRDRYKVRDNSSENYTDISSETQFMLTAEPNVVLPSPVPTVPAPPDNDEDEVEGAPKTLWEEVHRARGTHSSLAEKIEEIESKVGDADLGDVPDRLEYLEDNLIYEVVDDRLPLTTDNIVIMVKNVDIDPHLSNYDINIYNIQIMQPDGSIFNSSINNIISARGMTFGIKDSNLNNLYYEESNIVRVFGSEIHSYNSFRGQDIYNGTLIYIKFDQYYDIANIKFGIRHWRNDGTLNIRMQTHLYTWDSFSVSMSESQAADDMINMQPIYGYDNDNAKIYDINKMYTFEHSISPANKVDSVNNVWEEIEQARGSYNTVYENIESIAIVTDEVEHARTDFMGTEHDTLHERILSEVNTIGESIFYIAEYVNGKIDDIINGGHLGYTKEEADDLLKLKIDADKVYDKEQMDIELEYIYEMLDKHKDSIKSHGDTIDEHSVSIDTMSDDIEIIKEDIRNILGIGGEDGEGGGESIPENTKEEVENARLDMAGDARLSLSSRLSSDYNRLLGNIEKNTESIVAVDEALVKLSDDFSKYVKDTKEDLLNINKAIDSVKESLKDKVETKDFDSLKQTTLFGLSLWYGTEDEYSAIDPKDPNTLYFLEE